MFEFQGMWLPSGEKHFPEWMARNGEIVDGRGTYQIRKIRACLAACRAFRTAVDVGGHVGFWSVQLAVKFAEVHAFEPMEEFRQCFVRNLVERQNVYLYPVALGDRTGRVSIAYDPADSGGTHVAEDGNRAAVMRRLDEFAFRDVDFVKLDCEGYEEHALRGAEETLVRWWPVVCVEQKQHKLAANYGISGTPAVDYLKGLGYRLLQEIGGDYIMGHNA